MFFFCFFWTSKLLVDNDCLTLYRNIAYNTKDKCRLEKKQTNGSEEINPVSA
jgi:hypothetical protein